MVVSFSGRGLGAHESWPRSRSQDSCALLENCGDVEEIAYLLISLDRSTPAAVARRVREVSGVVDAHVTMGEFDVIALVETDHTKGFPSVASEIQRIEGVAKVSTCVVVRP